MNLATLIRLIALVSYSGLLIVILRTAPRTRESRAFALYILCPAFRSFSALMMSLGESVGSPAFWNHLLTLGFLAGPLVFFRFVQIFAKSQRFSKYTHIGSICFVILSVVTLLGYTVSDIRVENGLVHYEPGPGLIGAALYGYFFTGLALLLLFRQYFEETDPTRRNRVLYLLSGALLVALASFLNLIPSIGKYPIDVLATIVSALLTSYAILRYQLLDIRVVVRKGLLYSIPTAIIGVSYFIIIFLTVQFFRTFVGYQMFILSLLIAAITAVVARPLIDRAQSWVDRLFFREEYDSRLMLQRLGHTAASVLDLDRLMNMILDEVVTTIHIRRAAFFLRQETSGEFRLVTPRRSAQNTSLRLRKDHPIVDWLSSHQRALAMNDVEVIPHFKALWGEEREELEGLGAELFIPLKAKGGLVGILTVGPKLSEETYSQDDQLTLTTLASQVAVAIENARLYEQAQQEIAERKRAEEQIKASLREKEVLLKEIHHRVKNNLQVISSLLNFQSQSIGDKQALEMLNESRSRVKSMALVHEQLYQSKDLARIDFAEYVRNLATYLFHSYRVNPGTTTLKVEVDDVFLGVDIAIPCGLIIHELVSNSLRHAFPAGREGEIHVSLHVDDDRLTLVVKDNGVGFPGDLDFRSVESLGLRLVNILTHQLKGTIKLDRNGGTAFKMAFPSP